MRPKILLQVNDDRIYKVADREVVVKSKTVKILKEWNQRYPTILFDSKFLKELLKDIFGMKCLASSSVGGGRARNADVQHKPLDFIELRFIRGKH